MADYVPSQDAQFNTWFTQLVTYIQAHYAALGLTITESDNLDALLNDPATGWAAAYATHLNAQTSAAAAAVTKDNTKTDVIALLRPLIAQIQANPAVTDAQREAMQITVRATTRTAAPIPTTRPVAIADTRQRLQHTLSWKDETTPTSKAKPDGVRGAEIYCAIGATAPADPAAYHFLALDTASPYLAEHDPADGGKTAHYLLRWVNTRGEAGPWSETISATIGA